MRLEFLLCLPLALSMPAASEVTRQWSTRCLSFQVNGQDLTAQCEPTVQLVIPEAAEAGQKPALVFKSRVAQMPVVRLEVSQVQMSADGGTARLVISAMNGEPQNTSCNVARNAMNRAAAAITCVLPKATISQLVVGSEAMVNDLLGAVVTAHDRLNPSKPLAGTAPAAAPNPSQDRFAGRAVDTYLLNGTCAEFLANGMDRNGACQGPARLMVPNAVAVSQGDRPRLIIQSNIPGNPETTFYISEIQRGPNSIAMPLRGLNGAPTNPGSACTLTTAAPREIRCDGVARSTGANVSFTFRFSVATSEPEFQAFLRGMGAAEQTASAARKLDETGGVELSQAKQALFGIALGKPLAYGIQECRADPMPARLPLCIVSESDGKFAEMTELLGAAIEARIKASANRTEAAKALQRGMAALVNPEAVKRAGLRMYTLRVNPAMLDTSFLLTTGVDSGLRSKFHITVFAGQGGVQCIRFGTRADRAAALYATLQDKFGRPAAQEQETVTGIDGTKIQVPNALWSLPDVTIEYLGAGRFDMATSALIQRIDQLERQPAR